MHQYPLKCGCESRSRCTTVTGGCFEYWDGIRDTNFHIVMVQLPAPRDLKRRSRTSPWCRIVRRCPGCTDSAVVPGSQSIQFAIFAGTMVLIDHILDDLGPLSTHVILIVFLIFGYFWRVMVAGVLSAGALGDPGDCHPCHSGGTACGQASCRPVAEWEGLARAALAGAAW